jgi:transcriptional regulator with XRE-family HTH domain
MANVSLAHLGKAIKILRLENDVKQNVFSEMTGLSAAFICQIEKGKCNPSADKIFLIANALGVQPSEIFLKAEQYAQLQTHSS